MTAKKNTDLEKEKVDIMNEVNRVPMTQSSRERMSLNIYDLQYLIRLQEMSNDAFREELKEIYLKDNDQLIKDVVEVIQQELKPINSSLIEIKGDVKTIKGDLLELKERLKSDEDRIVTLERYASIGWTIFRNVVTVIVAAGISLIAFFQIHGRLK